MVQVAHRPNHPFLSLLNSHHELHPLQVYGTQICHEVCWNALARIPLDLG